MLQNQSSSTESAHANTEASVSGHCLDSSGKSIELGKQKEGFFSKSERKFDSEFLCQFRVGLRNSFVQEEQGKEGVLT